MTTTLTIKNKEVKIEKCIYKEDSFSLIEISENLIGQEIFNDAICNGVLNINALYKNFIDDNFEHHMEVQDHKITETILKDGSLHLFMCALDDKREIFRSYEILLKPVY